jgi:hypothetical protein
MRRRPSSELGRPNSEREGARVLSGDGRQMAPRLALPIPLRLRRLTRLRTSARTPASAVYSNDLRLKTRTFLNHRRRSRCRIAYR